MSTGQIQTAGTGGAMARCSPLGLRRGMEKITAETLKGWLEDPDVFVIDLRNQADWEDSNTKIRHAHRFDPFKVANWSKTLPRDKNLVLY